MNSSAAGCMSTAPVFNFLSAEAHIDRCAGLISLPGFDYRDPVAEGDPKLAPECQQQCVNTREGNCPCFETCTREPGSTTATGCTYSEPLEIGIAFRYSCGFQDRGDTRCKFANTETLAYVVDDSECPFDENGIQLPGPCMKCRTPEFEAAEQTSLRIALNAIDFTSPVDFVTYGDAVQLDATFMTDTGLERTRTAVVATNLTRLPNIIVAAQDAAGNTASFDVNSDVEVDVTVVKGRYDDMDTKQVFREDPGLTRGQQLERIAWKETFRMQLHQAELKIRRGGLELPQPKTGEYRLEFDAIDAVGPNRADVCKDHAGDSAASLFPELCRGGQCPGLCPSRTQLDLTVMPGATYVPNTKITSPALPSGDQPVTCDVLPVDEAVGCETRSLCVCGAAELDTSPGATPGTRVNPCAAGERQPARCNNEPPVSVRDNSWGGCRPVEVPLNEQSVFDCWNVINPIDPFSIVVGSRDVADNVRTTGGDLVRIDQYRTEEWCRLNSGTPDPGPNPYQGRYGFTSFGELIVPGVTTTSHRNCRAPKRASSGAERTDKIHCQCPDLSSTSPTQELCSPPGNPPADQAACVNITGCAWNDDGAALPDGTPLPQCEVDDVVCNPALNELGTETNAMWDRLADRGATCWQLLSKSHFIFAKDAADGSYTAAWSLDVAGLNNLGIDFMGPYDTNIAVQQCDDDGLNCEFVDTPQSPVKTEVVEIDCEEGSEQDSTGQTCECLPGWQKKATGKGCERCRDGWYKPSKSSEDPCIQCDFREDTAGVEGSDGPEDCVCAAGFYDPRRPYTTPDSKHVRKQAEFSLDMGSSYYDMSGPPRGKKDPNALQEGLELIRCVSDGVQDMSSLGEYLGEEGDDLSDELYADVQPTAAEIVANARLSSAQVLATMKAKIGPYPGPFARGERYDELCGSGKWETEGGDLEGGPGNLGKECPYRTWRPMSYERIDGNPNAGERWRKPGVPLEYKWVESYFWKQAEDMQPDGSYVYTTDGHTIETYGEQTPTDWNMFWQHDAQSFFLTRCQACPEGNQCDRTAAGNAANCGLASSGDGCVVCNGNETIGIRRGWWASTHKVPEWAREWAPVLEDGTVEMERTSRTVFRCKPASADSLIAKDSPCLGGENTAQCYDGHEGPTCAGCKPGYAVKGSQCYNCGAEEAIAMKIVFIVVGLIPVGILGYFFIRYMTPEIAVKGKILIAMGQVLGGFRETYQIKWPPMMLEVIQRFQVFDFDLFTLGNLGCQFAEINNFYYKFLMSCLLPGFLIGIIFAIFVSRKIIVKGKRLGDREPHARLVHILEDMNFQGQCFSRGFMIVIFLYLKTSATTLKIFQCRMFAHWEMPVSYKMIQANADAAEAYAAENYPRDGSYQVRVLEADYNLNCDDEATDGVVSTLSASWWRLFGWGMVGLYPLGVPAVFMSLLLKNRATINDSINVQKYGFIFKDYGPIFFFWEIWDLFRKLTMSGLLILFERGSADQLSAAILFATLCVVLHARCFPYSDSMANWIQLFVLISLELTLFGSLIMKMANTGDGMLEQNMMDYYLVAINVIVPGGLIGVVAYEIQQTVTANARAKMALAKKRKRQQQLLADSQGVDLRDVMKQVENESQAAALAKAQHVGLLHKGGDLMMHGTGLSMMGVAGLSMAKGIAHRVNVFSQRIASAKDLFPTLADEKLAVKKLLYDKERAEERYEQADREATDLAEWIAFARSHNASENELMSFVKAFGDELLADVDMDQDPMLQDIEAAASDDAKSPAVKLADNYPFIRSASMALRRHNFD